MPRLETSTAIAGSAKPWGINTYTWGRLHVQSYKASKLYLTASVTAPVSAILFSLVAIIIRRIVTPEIDGKNNCGGDGIGIKKVVALIASGLNRSTLTDRILVPDKETCVSTAVRAVMRAPVG
jgi:hypothetical protein